MKIVVLVFLFGSFICASLGQPGIHHTTVSSEVFLGGNFVEIGIRSNGKFGTDGKPFNFYGRLPGEAGIGMTGDADGFGVGTDLRIDYFLPGSPEEGFYFGFSVAGTRFEAKNSASSVVDTSTAQLASATAFAQLTDGGGSLALTQEISLQQDDKLFKNEVTLENVGTIPISEVRFMRSHDPDNTRDYGGSYTTINKIERSMPEGDSSSVVSATSFTGDPYYLAAGNKEAKILYATTDTRGRVSYGANGDGLSPSDGLYDPRVWDSPPANGTSGEADVYISIAFDVGTLAPGESTKLVYYTVLDNSDISVILNDLACLEEIPNCVACDKVDCVSCSDGYYLESNTCFPCPGTGCSVCTPTECSACFNGFFIDGTRCTSCSTRFDDCTRCTPSECADCSVASPGCNECSATACTGCEFGYFLDSGACTECSTRFTGCNECSPTECFSCGVGYYFDIGACTACSATFTGCNECSPSECERCGVGYHIDSGACTECSATFTGCTECSPSICTACAVGLSRFTGICIDCPATFANCIDCTLTACTYCLDNYHLENGQCVADTVFGYDDFSQYNFVEESTYSDSFDLTEPTTIDMIDFFASPNSNDLKGADNDLSFESCSDVLSTCFLMSVAILFFIM